jgi:RES domain-containing protein
VVGPFVKIAFAADAGVHLRRGSPARPAARFNRTGQDALYLSPDERSARVAMGQYVQPGDAPRVLLTFEVGRCALYDLRAPASADLHELARQPWQSALAAGVVPGSWVAADRLRAAGQVGLIDPSRRRPGLWHITLFRWNEPGAPQVRLYADPRPISIAPQDR